MPGKDGPSTIILSRQYRGHFRIQQQRLWFYLLMPLYMISILSILRGFAFWHSGKKSWEYPLTGCIINTENIHSEPFWKTVQLCYSGAIFSLIIMFEKKTVPLTKVVPFAKTAPQWSHFPEFSKKRLKRYFLVSGTKTVPKWGPSCGHENGSTVEPFRLHFFLSVKCFGSWTGTSLFKSWKLN